jgi:hypothetical protein
MVYRYAFALLAGVAPEAGAATAQVTDQDAKSYATALVCANYSNLMYYDRIADKARREPYNQRLTLWNDRAAALKQGNVEAMMQDLGSTGKAMGDEIISRSQAEGSPASYFAALKQRCVAAEATLFSDLLPLGE